MKTESTLENLTEEIMFGNEYGRGDSYEHGSISDKQKSAILQRLENDVEQYFSTISYLPKFEIPNNGLLKEVFFAMVASIRHIYFENRAKGDWNIGADWREVEKKYGVHYGEHYTIPGEKGNKLDRQLQTNGDKILDLLSKKYVPTIDKIDSELIKIMSMAKKPDLPS